MNDCIKIKVLDGVIIQGNGIIRNKEGHLIGRLVSNEKIHKDYKVGITVEPWEGELRETGNCFSFEQAEHIATLLREMLHSWKKLVTTTSGE